MAFSIRASSMALAAVFTLIIAMPVQPVGAQQQGVQRIPVSSILDRLGRLESEIVVLRQRPDGAGGEVTTRIGQLEAELRRLTGVVERLEYESARQAEINEKRMLDLDTRLQALESQRPTPFAAQPPAPAMSAAPQPLAPFAQTSPPVQPTVNLGGGPVVAFGTQPQLDTSPDLAALPFPTIPVPAPQPGGQAQTGVAIAGASVSPSAPVLAPAAPMPSPVALSTTGAQGQYDERALLAR